jgi:hypothetical protein
MQTKNIKVKNHSIETTLTSSEIAIELPLLKRLSEDGLAIFFS